MKIFKNNHYAITINKDSKKFYPFSRWLSNAVGSGNSNFNVNLLFKEKATTRDVLDGIFAAHVVRKVLDDLKIKSIDSSEGKLFFWL